MTSESDTRLNLALTTTLVDLKSDCVPSWAPIHMQWERQEARRKKLVIWRNQNATRTGCSTGGVSTTYLLEDTWPSFDTCCFSVSCPFISQHGSSSVLMRHLSSMATVSSRVVACQQWPSCHRASATWHGWWDGTMEAHRRVDSRRRECHRVDVLLNVLGRFGEYFIDEGF